MQQLAAIEEALGIVQQTIELLTSRKDDEAAFDIARAQYRSSIRDSWPNNLSSLTDVLDRIHRDPGSKLDEAERARLAHAVHLLRNAMNQ